MLAEQFGVKNCPKGKRNGRRDWLGSLKVGQVSLGGPGERQFGL